MIVNRRVYSLNPLKKQDAAELFRELARRFPHPHSRRLLFESVGPLDTMVVEVEYANLAEYEDYFRRMSAAEWFPELSAKWHSLKSGKSTSEIWNIEVLP